MDVIQEETLVHCIAHGDPVRNGETVYVLKKEDENVGVLCGACATKLRGTLRDGDILLFKGVTIPGVSGVKDCYSIGIPVGSISLTELQDLGK